MRKTNELKYDMSSHPLYSFDLASSNFDLSPRIKKFLSRRGFSNEEMKEVVDGYFALTNRVLK
jgi:SOS response regulatory protein OraA/RecX